MKKEKFTIVTFLCNWCSYEGADRAGSARLNCPANIRVIRVMCSGRVEPQFVIQAFRDGASGVLILGCHPGDCHYKKGNYKARRRIILLKKTLKQFGIEQDRVRLDWVSASEGTRFAKIANEMADTIKQLGPLSELEALN
ncbi:MAG: hydrogenase iron-sulfur subunit [Candidatus Cloacimonetes bacterium]|nr:hydrogenase iron-sulfur subunit [Candidatus Cloacimonadota bacterium]